MEAVFPSISKKLKTEEFKNRKRELMIRAEHVIGGLQSMSLQASALDTQSLIELYYGLYNPELGKSQKVEDVTKLDIE
jgi:hypothetical protein